MIDDEYNGRIVGDCEGILLELWVNLGMNEGSK